jgi:hypothetical protein
MNLSPQETKLVVNALYHTLDYAACTERDFFNVAEWEELLAQFALLERLAPEMAAVFGKSWLAKDHKAVAGGN